MRARTGILLLVSGASLIAFSPAPADPVPAAVPAVAAAPSSPAPGAAAQRVRGTLATVDGPFLTLKTGEKKTITLGVTTDTRIVHNRSLQLSDLQPGVYVGVAALKGADGKMRAQGIRLYPETMRGVNEGLYATDPANPSRLLINGTVTAATPGGVGGTVSVAYHGGVPVSGATDCAGRAAAGGCTGAADVQFARGVPILSIEAGDVSLLSPGAVVSANAAPDASGTLVATSVTVERDAPPAK